MLLEIDHRIAADSSVLGREEAGREDHLGSVGRLRGRRNAGFFLSTYLIDEVVAIDAGGLGSSTISRPSAGQHIFITHSHMDHIASLPIFLETVFEAGDHCVTVHAGEETLESLKHDVFNDRVWPELHRDVGQGTAVRQSRNTGARMPC